MEKFPLLPIDKGIPIPPRRTGNKAGARRMYPWRKMGVGDRFLARDILNTRMQAQIRNAARKYQFEFTSRTVRGGVRVWRIA